MKRIVVWGFVLMLCASVRFRAGWRQVGCHGSRRLRPNSFTMSCRTSPLLSNVFSRHCLA
jgi:hypothetical protein